MKIGKCINCGNAGERLQCNSCSNTLCVCPDHRGDFFPVDTQSELVCVDCVNAGMGGEGRYLHRFDKKEEK